MSVCAIVPAHNEAERVGATVAALLRGGVADRVLVVDDGSHDETARLAREAGADVQRLAVCRGKGAAVAYGLARAEGDILLLADADLGKSAERLIALVQKVREREADLAIAQFSVSGGFGVAKRLARRGIWWLTGSLFEAPLSGQRAITSAAARVLTPLPPGWGMEVAMTVQALWNGLRVMEIPLDLEHRTTGRSFRGFAHRGRQCGAVAGTLWRLRQARPRPARGASR